MKKMLAAIVIGTVATVASALPIQVGLGVHYNLDFSMSMDDMFNQPVTLSAITGTTTPLFTPSTFMSADSNAIKALLPAGITFDSLSNALENTANPASQALPISFSRSGFEKSMVNLGGKVYLNIKPVINTGVEVAFNLGGWQYDASIQVPKSVKTGTALTADQVTTFLATGDYSPFLEMDTIPLTLEEFGLSYGKIFGLTKTPYTKLNVDVTIKKYLKYPADKVLRLYIGGGAGLHMGTPILTPEFVGEIMQSALANASDIGTLGAGAIDYSALAQQVVDKMIKDGRTPTVAPHIAAGAHIKIPVAPIGFYIDGKYQFIVGDLDDNAPDLKGNGLRLNAGISLGL